MSALRFWCCMLPLLGGCGYTLGHQHEVKSVSVHVFDSKFDSKMATSSRASKLTPRFIEFELTRIVTHELMTQGVEVNTADAPYELRGEIVEYNRPALVSVQNDVLVAGSVTVNLRIELYDKKTGQKVFTETHAETALLISARGETVDTAHQECFQKLAKWVADRLDQKW